MLLLALIACKTPADSDTVDTVPWSGGVPHLADEIGPTRDLVPLRSIVHLHSAWSHDACDGDPLPDGEPNQPCLDDLRTGLCETHVDVAFLTDHPAHAATATYEELFHAREGDRWVEVAGQKRGLVITCDDGHEVLWLPGIEDELMPVGLDRHVADTPDDNDRIYNQYDGEAVALETAAGASVFVAHTEQRELAKMQELQDAGISGHEVFNLHAAFDPDIRVDYLGYDSALGWLGDIDPFSSPQGTAEPDLFVLAVLAEQAPSIATWDALLARGPMVGTAGTDAHQNVLPLDFRDGDRGDSYRRMLRWFSNVVLAGATGPDDVQAALAAGRSYVAFDIFGVPDGFDFHLEAADGAVVEMGGEGSGGTLVVGCPTLSSRSPRGAEAPEITVTVFKDGQPWSTQCGEQPTDGPGVYRARVDIVPRHLIPFLGADPDPWVHEYPWVYGNAIRVR